MDPKQDLPNECMQLNPYTEGISKEEEWIPAPARFDLDEHRTGVRLCITTAWTIQILIAGAIFLVLIAAVAIGLFLLLRPARPKDGLCDIIFWDFFYDSDRGTFLNRHSVGLEWFLEFARNYNGTTQFGIGIDHRLRPQVAMTAASGDPLRAKTSFGLQPAAASGVREDSTMLVRSGL
ncbi:hypothetical protein HPB47_015454 [Ixodes persulcatus]|uniref:Uncharacterized protein n=1 Tax=Ixodes persulcatus TaxID=34615 RepID=A0AC60QTK6_IXOPE|nr:hypothetical protein HPB47_015454 [Ixodes persulcatus]